MGARLGAPVIGINRPDLHAVLSAAGSYCVQTGSEVTGFEQHDSAVSVKFADGRLESGAVVIGADGIDSVIRAQLLGKQAPRHSGLTMWRANVEMPEHSMPPVPFLAFWGRGTKFVIYRAGPGLLSWEAIVASEPGGTDPTGDRKRVVASTSRDFAIRSFPSSKPPTKWRSSGRTSATGRRSITGAPDV
jgi:2-polyprenyl-6-methoxyphenol hydroxylase-like FAD-dependent oxidoreductase